MNLLRCVGWVGFFVLTLAWVPFFGPFLSLLTPLPFLYYSSKLGLSQGMKLGAYSLILLSLFSALIGHPRVIIYCFQFALLGTALSVLFRRDLSFGYTLLAGTGFMMGVGLVFLSLVALSMGKGPFELLLSYLSGNLNEAVRFYREMGMEEKRVGELLAFQKAFMNTLSKIYPSLMVIGTGFLVWLNVLVSKGLFRARKIEYPRFVPLDRWRVPEALVWIVIGSGFSLFLPFGGIRIGAANVLIVMMGIYLLQGISILLFFLNRYRVPVWARAGVYFLLIIQQIFLAILALVGLFDQWIDFRKIHKKTSG